MTEDELKAFFETDQGKDIASHIDKRVGDALDTYKINHPAPEPTGDNADVIAQQADEIAQLKIWRHVDKECVRRGIPGDYVEELGIAFTELADVDPLLEKIQTRFEEARTGAVNHELVNSFKPGGSQERETVDLDTITDGHARLLEEADMLDDLVIVPTE